MRTEIIGDATLILGECREAMASMISVSHVICDPPYEESMHAAKVTPSAVRTDGHNELEALDFGSIGPLRQAVCDEAKRLSQGWFIAFCTPEGIASWRDAIEAAGIRYKRACFWDKPDSAPQFNGQGPAMAVEPFVTAWCGIGHSYWNGGGRRNVFRHLTNPPNRDGFHPTEKPIALMAEIVSLFTQPGDTVLDPFMGSGSTGIACLKTGRKFIGIELDNRYFDRACTRIEQFTRQPDMFLKPPLRYIQPTFESYGEGFPK